MSQQPNSISYLTFYDQVLAEIEHGNVQQGIALLAGMLDAVAMQAVQLEQARGELARHMLHQLLLEDPIYRQAASHPNQYAELVRVITSAAFNKNISPTGRRLFDVASKLPVIRALRERRVTADLRLNRAWSQGLRICLLGTDDMCDIDVLSGRDHSNITQLNYTPGKRHTLSRSAHGSFDLVCAFAQCDSIDGATLPDMLAFIKASLARQGTAILSALLPNHLGSGWRNACLLWDAQTHDEQTLRYAFKAAGLKSQIYRDEADCFVWCELRHARTESEEKHHGH